MAEKKTLREIHAHHSTSSLELDELGRSYFTEFSQFLWLPAPSS